MSDESANAGEMDVQAIMGMIPHRYPLLLVDRVISCVPGVSISGFKSVTRHDCLGAAAKTATLPEFLTLEALAQLAVILTFRSLGIRPTGKELLFFAGIDRAKFVRRAIPGDRLDLDANVIRMMPGKGIGKFSTRATVGNDLVTEAVMMAALRL